MNIGLLLQLTSQRSVTIDQRLKVSWKYQILLRKQRIVYACCVLVLTKEQSSESHNLKHLDTHHIALRKHLLFMNFACWYKRK